MLLVLDAYFKLWSLLPNIGLLIEMLKRAAISGYVSSRALPLGSTPVNKRPGKDWKDGKRKARVRKQPIKPTTAEQDS